MALHGSSLPDIVSSSLVTSCPTLFPPLLQPPSGRPAKKRKTKESARRAFLRSLGRVKSRESQDIFNNKENVRSDELVRECKKPAIRRKHLCSRCSSTGHNSKRCRSYTDSMGRAMKKSEQVNENKRSIVIEIQMPGKRFYQRV